MKLHIVRVLFTLMVCGSLDWRLRMIGMFADGRRPTVRDLTFWRQAGIQLRTSAQAIKFITSFNNFQKDNAQRERRHQEEAQCFRGTPEFDDASLSEHHLCSLQEVPIRIRMPKSVQHLKELVAYQNPSVAMVKRCKGVCQKYGHMKCSPKGKSKRRKVMSSIRWDHKNTTECYTVTVKSHTDCDCRCTLTDLKCQKFGDNFSLDNTTCSCKCELTEAICKERLYKRLDKEKCECREKIDIDTYYVYEDEEYIAALK